MAYLHHYSPVRVVHCDLKPSNILLDDDFTALVTDFGIARLVKGDENMPSCDSTTSFNSTHGLLCGSVGYIAPEYGMGKHASTKGDVYSFGVLVLEIVTSRRPTNVLIHEGSSLHEWVKRQYSHKLDNIVEQAFAKKLSSRDPSSIAPSSVASSSPMTRTRRSSSPDTVLHHSRARRQELEKTVTVSGKEKKEVGLGSSQHRVSSTDVAVLGEKAILYLKRHPQNLPSLTPHFTPEAASYVLLNSQFNQPLTLKFLNWAQPHPFLTPQCKCLALHLLTRFNLYKTAQTLAEDLASYLNDTTGTVVFHLLKDSYHSCNSTSAVFDLVVKSYSRLNHLDKAINIVNLAIHHGFSPTVLSYNAILDSIFRFRSRRSSIHDAERVFGDMMRNGVSPNVYTYNVMIRGVVAAGDLKSGFLLMREMERKGCLPNVVTYNTLIAASCKEKRVEEAITLLRAMAKKGVEPNLISYNAVINGLCGQRRMKETQEVLEEMNVKGLAPDQVTYNTLVNGFCKEGNFHQGLVLLHEMAGKGLSPNVVTYTTLINGMCKVKNLSRAMELFDQMLVRGLCPNERTYTTIIDGFCQQGLMDEAYKVLNEMIVSGFSPSVITYNALIHGYCFLGRVEEAVGILRGMVERGLSPDVVSYSTVIAGFCRNGEVGKAFEMKVEMVEKGILPDAVMYSSLIQGICQQRKLSEAFDLLREMLDRGLSPDEVTYTSLMNAYCVEGELSKAFHLHDEMIEKGFLPDLVTYSVLINGLNKKARTKEAKKLLLKLFFDESVPNDVTYDTLIENCSNNEFKSVIGLVKGFCMKGLMNEADRVFKTMLQRNYKPDGAVYNLIIHGHCRCGNVHKAYNMYIEMVNQGFVPHMVTVIALIKTLSREGMNDELSWIIQNILSSCRLNDAELPKALIEINFKEGNMDAVLNVLTEMAKDGLLPDGGKYSYAPASA
ncbi:Tetratricopeptide-like helical domain superfamily [Sesbania bispinosa]|nr:Tetratricopeptide-like helical domain superfamily [Sesbania bispinosa]